MTPTARTLARLRELGYVAGVVERYNSYTRQRADLFGFVDIACVHPDLDRVLFVQATSGDHHAERVAKIRASDAFPAVARVADVEVWSWAKRGERGKRKVWTLRRERVEE